MFTVPQVARRIGCTRHNVLHHIHRGNLPATKVGGVFIVDEADARSFADQYDREWQDESTIQRSTTKTNGSCLN